METRLRPLTEISDLRLPHAFLVRRGLEPQAVRTVKLARPGDVSGVTPG
jgi:hypothetical protein